ncbi:MULTISPECIES: hypothetical protein [unclassified Duganella]|jgi:hypothetical protein|uniref:hypothetical protein n=1 Tax=unclassified Duganella TaxID=2636909 RepID=UPI00087F749D|nr:MULTISPECIES: hypothetical protein [unclassified Duganella]SDG05826.1 hypothetical protein SAMN05216320_102510 [Duganella sp. OV458]SDI99567.1 hypothetical protein SAMN05428973_10241 [Duganella sp. OV510]
MKLITGKIVSGQVVVEDMPFDEGATVIVLSGEESEFELTPQQEADMLLSLEEADRGETVSASDLLKSLRSQA